LAWWSPPLFLLLSRWAPVRGVAYPGKEVVAVAKIVCRPERKGKTGPKTVRVKAHDRSKAKPTGKTCK
jgi:hypothetical protein